MKDRFKPLSEKEEIIARKIVDATYQCIRIWGLVCLREYTKSASVTSLRSRHVGM
jgi:hypothetical protein